MKQPLVSSDVDDYDDTLDVIDTVLRHRAADNGKQPRKKKWYNTHLDVMKLRLQLMTYPSPGKDAWKISEEQFKELYQIFSRRLADLGTPMPSSMVRRESAATRLLNPLLKDLIVDELSFKKLHVYFNELAFKAFYMMLCVMLVIILVSYLYPVRLDYSVSLGVGFWHDCMFIYIFCTLTYLFWLCHKMKLMMKYKLLVTEWVRKMKRELPDRCTHDHLLLDLLRLKSNILLGGFPDGMIYLAGYIGCFGMFLCAICTRFAQ